jgi:hypothetical protein
VTIATLDWLRPKKSRSHLGRFVQSIIDGGAGDIINRKLAQNLYTLIHTTLFAYLVPLLLIALAYVLARGSRDQWGPSWIRSRPSGQDSSGST